MVNCEWANEQLFIFVVYDSLLTIHYSQPDCFDFPVNDYLYN